MTLSQNQLDKIAIKTILSQLEEASYPEIALRGGEGLASPLMELVQVGEVIRDHNPDRPINFQTLYRLNTDEI